MFDRVREHGPPADGSRLRLGADWLFEPSLNFYRRKDATGWIKAVDRKGPRGDEDWFVLLEPKYDDFVSQHKLVRVEVDAVAGSVLAAPPRTLKRAIR